MTVRSALLNAAVAVHGETWDEHVALRHPEVLPFFDYVVGTIEAPEMIARDARHTERVYFLRRWPDEMGFPATWLHVLVLLPPCAMEGRFLSAWASRRIGGREIIWRASDQN